MENNEANEIRVQVSKDLKNPSSSLLVLSNKVGLGMSANCFILIMPIYHKITFCPQLDSIFIFKEVLVT